MVEFVCAALFSAEGFVCVVGPYRDTFSVAPPKSARADDVETAPTLRK